jgi:hypothetical protein
VSPYRSLNYICTIVNIIRFLYYVQGTESGPTVPLITLFVNPKTSGGLLLRHHSRFSHKVRKQFYYMCFKASVALCMSTLYKSVNTYFNRDGRLSWEMDGSVGRWVAKLGDG